MKITTETMVVKNNVLNKNLEWENKKGIYGIYIDDCLVYIGSTFKFFKSRFQSHKAKVKGDVDLQNIHKQIKIALEKNKNVEFKPMVVLEDLSMLHKKTITEKELKCMELALITALKPMYNIEGVLKPYSF